MGPDILLILVAALIIILVWRGPKMLPRIGESLGRTVKGVRENVPSAIKGEDPEGGETGDPRDR